GLAAFVGPEGMERTIVFFVLVVAEREHLVLHNRYTGPHAGIPERERAWIHDLAHGLGADVAFTPRPVIDGATELIGPASGDRVDGGADEVSLTDVERGDADLHLFDGFQGDWRDTCSAAGATF